MYIIRSDYIPEDILQHVLFALTPANALVCETMLCTGLRVSDVLQFRTEKIKQKTFTVTEQKTGKKRRIYLPSKLKKKLLAQAGREFVFEGRSGDKPRTRQAVYCDLRRASKAFRLKGVNTPHSLRKTFAVELYRKTGDLELCRQKLNHDDIETTLIYVLADHLKKGGKL